MSAITARLRLDRNAGAFFRPDASVGVSGLAEATADAFSRVRRAFQTIKVAVDGADDGTGGLTSLHTGSETPQVGALTLSPGSYITVTQAGTVFTVAAIPISITIKEYKWDASADSGKGQLQERSKTVKVLEDGSWGAWGNITGGTYTDCP